MPDAVGADSNPRLSIVVLNFNLGKITEECLASLRAHTSGISYEIVVVDNGSNPQEKLIVRNACDLHRARLVELNRNLFFGEANNIGAEAARGEFLLLLNNDVVVTPGYIAPLLRALETAHRAGAVGAQLRFPDGRLQEAGAYVRPDGWTVRHGLVGGPSEVLTRAGLHIVDYCSAACLLLRRSVFLEMGGFDPLFDPGYFEDVDLCLRLRAAGSFTYYCADAAVIHRESATSKTIWSHSNRKAILQRNHDRFVGRWGPYIEQRLFASATPPRVEPIAWSPTAAASDTQPALFLHGPGLIGPDRIWSTIVRLGAALSDKAQPVFVAEEACSRCRIYTMARDGGRHLDAFSLRRAADLSQTPDDTIAVFRADARNNPEIASGNGPLLDDVRSVLSAINPAMRG